MAKNGLKECANCGGVWGINKKMCNCGGASFIEAPLTTKTPGGAKLACCDGLAKLVDLQQDYIKLILEEAEETVPIAYAHGWRSTRYGEGKRIREELEKLTEQFG